MPDISPANESDKVPWSAVDNSLTMSANPLMVPSEAQAYQADQDVYNATRNRAYIGTSLVYDAISYSNIASTNSSGMVTFYLTSDRTATGTALYTNVYPETVVAMPYGTASNYQITTVTVSSDKKTVTVGVNQLGSVVLGLVNVTSAAAGVPVNLTLVGK